MVQMNRRLFPSNKRLLSHYQLRGWIAKWLAFSSVLLG